jgi:RNA recognition motif-containing protein
LNDLQVQNGNVKSKAFDDDEEEEDKKKPEVKTPAKSNAGGVGGKRLFVGNLSFRATEDTLYEFFKAAGPVSDVYIAQDDNGSRGFGFVRMDTEEGVAKVLSPEPLPYGKLGLLIF